jgi:hypothetical protein
MALYPYQKSFQLVSSFTKPATNTAYSALDFIGSGTGTKVNRVFDVTAFDANETIKVVGASLQVNFSAIPASLATGVFNLYLFNANITALNDNDGIGFLKAESGFCFKLQLPALSLMGDYAFTEIATPPNKVITFQSTPYLIGCLQTVSGYTPDDTTATPFSIILNVERASVL